MKKSPREPWERNRHTAQRPHRTRFWCACDMVYLALGKRCPVCGWRAATRRFKKWSE